MKQQIVLQAKARSDMGKGASRLLRRANEVPGIVYGAHKEPLAIAVDHNLLLQLLEKEAFYTQILNLDIDGSKESVVLRDLQRHPYKPRILHLDLQRISDKEKVMMHIPLHFIGEDVAPGVKVSGGLVSHLETDVEILCLPKDLPEFIEVDLSNTEINQTIHLSDLKLPENVELVALSHGEDKPVVTIYVPRAAAAEEETEAPTASEVPVVGEEAAKEEEAAVTDKS